MVAGAAAASRAAADAVKPTSASRRVKVFPMGAVIADGPIRCCGKTRLSGPSLVASYRQILCDQAGAVSQEGRPGFTTSAGPKSETATNRQYGQADAPTDVSGVYQDQSGCWTEGQFATAIAEGLRGTSPIRSNRPADLFEPLPSA